MLLRLSNRQEKKQPLTSWMGSWHMLGLPEPRSSWTKSLVSAMQREITSDRIGRYIRNHRKKQGISQDDLARSAHITRQYLSLIENGRRYLKVEDADRLLKALGKAIVIGGRCNDDARGVNREHRS